MNTKNIIFGLLILLFASCQDKEFVQRDNKLRVIASMPQVNTRLVFSSGDGVTHVNWEEGDFIGLISSAQNNIAYKAVTTANGVAEFISYSEELTASEGEEVIAYYPHGFVNDDKSVEHWSKEPFMYAKGVVQNNELQLDFKHVCAYLKITITKEVCQYVNPILKWVDLDLSTFREGVEDNPALGCYGGIFDFKTETFDSGSSPHGIRLEIENGHDLTQSSYTTYIPILPQEAGVPITLSVTTADDEVLKIMTRDVPEGGFQAQHVYSLDTGREDIVALEDAQRQALIDLYNATDGDNWTNKTNWCSDKPIHLWYGVNNNQWGDTIKSPHVFTLNLQVNNLKGTLPESFSLLMDNASSIVLEGNNLYGVIPEKIRKHTRWNEFGWNIIQYDCVFGEGFDMTDINLHIDNRDVTMLVDGTTTSAFDILKNNKLTCITAFASDDWPLTVPTDKFINKHLDYHNKGLGTVISVCQFQDFPLKPWIEVATSHYPADIVWLNRAFDDLQLNAWGGSNTYVLNDKGELVYYMSKLPSDYTVAQYDRYIERLDSVYRANLGEPETHEPFITEVYTSTDKSRDGEVVTLQKASVGNGIDIVFMGDAYVDRDMETDGKYETDMKASMEHFFSIEPYKTYRNRFNVYAVKVVSPNEYVMEGRIHAINYDNNICFNYAGKVPNIDLNKVTIINVVNNPSTAFLSGYTNMFENGSSVAHIQVGGPSEIIVHEAGGHGFGKLADEYIYGGYESAIATEETKTSMSNEYGWGWYANLDFVNSPTGIQWAHFLSDDRYKEEVGIYEGAWLWGTGVYRPSENSVMNTDYTWFNAPSREAIYKAIMKLSEGDDWVYNFEDFATYDAINRNAATATSRSVAPLQGDKRQVKHQPPTVIKGSWRDAKKNAIVVPFR